MIDGDGRWSKLALVDGQLTALHGWSNEGSWETIDTSLMNGPGVYQLNSSIDGSGTVITIPQLAAEPELMRLDNNGVFRGDYARVERAALERGYEIAERPETDPSHHGLLLLRAGLPAAFFAGSVSTDARARRSHDLLPFSMKPSPPNISTSRTELAPASAART